MESRPPTRLSSLFRTQTGVYAVGIEPFLRALNRWLR